MAGPGFAPGAGLYGLSGHALIARVLSFPHVRRGPQLP